MARQFLGIPVFFLCSFVLLAGDGKIPIYQATTIDAPGHYLMTRDIPVSGQDAIIIATNHVVLDLGGHTINLGSAHKGVVIDDGHTDITIRNGIIRDATFGVSHIPTIGVTRLVIEDLRILSSDDSGIWIENAQHVDIQRCHIDSQSPGVMAGSGIYVAAPDATSVFGGTIRDNTVVGTDGHGIYLENLANGKVVDNEVRRFAQANSTYRGIAVVCTSSGEARNNRIEGNLVNGDGVSLGFGIRVTNSHGNLVINNVVSAVGKSGFSFAGARGSMVANNLAEGNGEAGFLVADFGVTLRGNTSLQNSGDGIHVQTDANTIFIDNNFCADNSGQGLNINDGSGNASYRNNMLRDNGSGSVIGGVDAGGNIL